MKRTSLASKRNHNKGPSKRKKLTASSSKKSIPHDNHKALNHNLRSSEKIFKVSSHNIQSSAINRRHEKEMPEGVLVNNQPDPSCKISTF